MDLNYDLGRQAWIVVWRSGEVPNLYGSHEGVFAQDAEIAVQVAQKLLPECDYPVAAYNLAQCLRMHDLLLQFGHAKAPYGHKGFVVFYDSLFANDPGCSRLDRLSENWILLPSTTSDQAICYAQQLLERRFTPFLAYGLDDVEIALDGLAGPSS